MGSIPRFDLATIDDLDERFLTPEQSIEELIQGSPTKSKLSEWLGVMNATKSSSSGTIPLKRVDVPNFTEFVEVCPSQSSANSIDHDAMLKVTVDDVSDELAYWNLGVIEYVIGLNPRLSAFDGFCHRIWGKSNVNKVIPIKKGVFLIRFLNNESKNKALN